MKKKIIWLIVIIITIAAGGYFYNSSQSQSMDYLTEELSLTSITKTVSATGSVKSADEIDLNFSISGQLQRVDVEVGDEVQPGQVLAQLDTGTAAAAVSNARANVVAAEADLDKLRAGASREDIAVTKQQVKQAELNLSVANTNLLNLEKERDDRVASYRQTSFNVLATKNFYSRTALDLINTIMTDPDAKASLSVKNMQYKIEVSDQYNRLKPRFDKVNDEIQLINENASDQEIVKALDDLIAYQSDISALLSTVYLMLESSVSGTNFTTADLESYKTNVKTQQTNIDTSLSAVQTARSNLSNSVVTYQNKINDANHNIQAQQEALDLAKAQLELKEAGPRTFEVATQEAKLKQAEAALQSALADLNKYIIKAPIAGTIIKVSKSVGEQTSVSESIIKMIGKSELEIEVDIPEADIADIAIGKEAQITLDAYGDSVIFNGRVTFIEPAETVIQDVVYYKVTVQFDLTDAAVKSGMTANVDIMIERRNNVLAVPSRAIYKQGDKNIVKVLSGEQIDEVEVDLGLRDDLGYREIISDLLKVGDTIIINNGNE